MDHLDPIDPADQSASGQADEIARQAADDGSAHCGGCYTNEGDVKPEFHRLAIRQAEAGKGANWIFENRCG
jgi:hypothetical protein